MTAPTVSEPADTPEPMAATKALILDIDGVVSPVHGHTAWGDDVVAGNVFGPAYVSPTMCARLDTIAEDPDLECAWLTDWNQQMRDTMDPFPGTRWPAVADPVEGLDVARQRAGEAWNECRWWKWWALDAWLEARPAITTLVWCDDHLARPLLDHHDEYDVEQGAATRRDAFTGWLSARGIAALLIAPATNTGLTPAHVDQIERFLVRKGAEP